MADVAMPGGSPHLWFDLYTLHSHPGDLTTWSIETSDNPEFHRVGSRVENNGNSRCRCLGRQHCWCPTDRNNQPYTPSHEISRERSQSSVLPVGPAIFDG
jgi:hypothetical protein